MRSARNRLILLGFICQGLTWDDYLLPLANLLLWLVCLTWLRGRLRLSLGMECLLMLAGAAAGLFAGRALGLDTHYFLGHGLTVMQAVRLTRPLDRREKVFSIVMACIQLGVGCTFLFDLRFIPVFLGMIVLLPGALKEVETETFAEPGATVAGQTSTGGKAIAAIFGIAVVFFLVFPRGSFGGSIQPLRAGSSDATSMLDAVVDPTRSADAQSRRVLLQVQGEKLGYLRCYGLSEFDGVRWTESPSHDTAPIEPGRQDAGARSLSRRVSVKRVSYLGHILPTDGWVVRLSGRFFRDAVRNDQDAIECGAMRNTANNIYQYWIDPRLEPAPLSAETRRRMTMAPPQSERLRAWLDTLVAGETNRAKIARRLESYLRDNFKYTLGAPELRRLDPVDDFVFNQKQGHCERFASTLALLLRMRQIPSRVVIGYLPHRRGGMDGWYNVRFNDAHAWTEAYFEHTGWVTLDATPAATLSESGFSFQDWRDTLDLAWNLGVVNFDGVSQRYLLSASWRGAVRLFDLARENVLLPAIVVLAVIWIGIRPRGKKPAATASARPPVQIMADDYYGQMLRLLGKQGLHRADQQTPLEFLSQLTPHAHPWLADARLITTMFCATKYGHQAISPAVQWEIEQALKRIKAGLKPTKALKSK